MELTKTGLLLIDRQALDGIEPLVAEQKARIQLSEVPHLIQLSKTVIAGNDSGDRVIRQTLLSMTIQQAEVLVLPSLDHLRGYPLEHARRVAAVLDLSSGILLGKSRLTGQHLLESVAR